MFYIRDHLSTTHSHISIFWGRGLRELQGSRLRLFSLVSIQPTWKEVRSIGYTWATGGGGGGGGLGKKRCVV